LVVGSGGSASNVNVEGYGGQLVFAGGTINNYSVAPGGSLAVASGATVSGLVISSGVDFVLSAGGTAIDTTVLSGGKISSTVGTFQGLTVSNGGLQVVSSSGGKLILSSGVHVGDVTVENGGEIEFAGGSVTDLHLSVGAIESIADGVVFSGQRIDNLVLVVSSGGTAIDTTLVNSEIVYAGGKIDGGTVSAGRKRRHRPGNDRQRTKDRKRRYLAHVVGRDRC